MSSEQVNLHNFKATHVNKMEVIETKKVDINNLMSKVREKEKKETKENLVFFGLVGSLIFISGILLSL